MTMAKRAIVRPPSSSYCNCISSHPEHKRLSLELALEQHRAYVTVLSELGLEVIELTPLDTYPDACFVEDTVVIHKSKALMSRPEPLSRRGEVESVESILKDYLRINRVEEPATLEGGDVIHTNRGLISGVTQRTNLQGIQEMRDKLDIEVRVVDDDSIIHLKSYVTYLEGDKMLGIARYSNHQSFDGFDFLIVPDIEVYASNSLTIDGTVIIPTGYPQTAELLKQSDFDVILLSTTEFEKCDGALTCLSIIF